MISLPTPDDATNTRQEEARAALDRVVNECLEIAERWQPGGEPPYLERVTYQYMTHALQMISDISLLLRPGDLTFHHAHAVSGILRTQAELFARQLAIWGAGGPPQPGQRLKQLLAESLRQENLALDAAELAGTDGAKQRASLKRFLDSLGSEPRGVNVANTLRDSSEYEIEAVYRWESDYVHLGAAALMARVRTFGEEKVTADVALYPLSLWRVAQLTWAAYGVGLRLFTLLASKIRFDYGRLVVADEELRPVVRSAAARSIRDDEPPSPPYWQFAFPLWSEQASPNSVDLKSGSPEVS